MGAAISGFIDANAPVYAGVALVIALAAITASIVPARRAARVDPWFRCATTEERRTNFLCSEVG